MASKFKFLFSLCFCLAFGAYESELANFDKNFALSNEKVKFHHQLKSIYIQTVLNDDEKTKIEILKRLIISSKALNLDDKSYVNELKELGILASNSKKLPPQQSKEKTLFILNSSKKEDGVFLKLSKDIDKKDIKTSSLKEKGNYRYIIDFEASLDGGRKEFSFDELKILLAQFDQKTVRLVLHSKDELEYKLETKDKSLVLNFKDKKVKNPTKTTQITQAATTKKQENLPKTQKKTYILKSLKEENGIRLILSDELDDIKQFVMKDKQAYRVVLNFEASLEGGRKNFSFGKNVISLTQYSPKIVRVVLSSNNEFELVKENDEKSLFVGFKGVEKSLKQDKIAKNTPKTNSTPAKINTKNKVIVIDAGHGGKDGGAVNGKLLEKNIVLSVALKIGDELKKRGYKVFYTRTNDKFINLRDRTKIANDKRANLFISIHANAAINKSKAKTMQGIETFFLSPARSERSKEVAALENKADLEEANFFLKQNFLSALSREKIIASNRLAIDIQKNILSSLRSKYKVRDGGVREAPFWVLVGAQDMPAILVEIGYISHPEEGKRLANRLYQELLAKGVALGVQNYFRNNPQ